MTYWINLSFRPVTSSVLLKDTCFRTTVASVVSLVLVASQIVLLATVYFLYVSSLFTGPPKSRCSVSLLTLTAGQAFFVLCDH